jgi:hypothetical protein
MRKIVSAILSCSTVILAAFLPLRAQEVTLKPDTALRIAIDHRVRSHIGALVSGHLTEPVYLVDHEVIPAGSLISGTIRCTHAAPRRERVRALLAADFTPPRVSDIVFESITLIVPGSSPQVIPIDAPAERTDASVLTLGTKKQKQSIKAQVGDVIKQSKQDTVDTLKHHHFTETIEKWALGQLPYHPEMIWTGSRFNADLATATSIPDTPHPALPTEDLGGHLPEGALHARLVSPLTSETAKRGDPVEAIITQPLLSPDKSRLLVPEGTLLHGVVMQTKAARSFGRNGDLRFAFRKLDLPSADGTLTSTEIHGRLSAAETSAGQHVTMDEEGQVKASDGPAKYAEPLLLGVLAIAATPDDDHRGAESGVNPGAATVASNGFGLIARVVSLSTRNTNVLQGFAYYSLGKSLYFHFVAKGHDTTFPRDTEIQVTLSER